MKKSIVVLVTLMLLVTMCALTACIKDDGIMDTYTIKQIDLTEKPANVADKYASLYGYNVVDDKSIDDEPVYLAHPDAVLADDGETMVVYYPTGHGKGAIRGKKSTDGKTWTEIAGLPESWKTSMETPTIYRLDFKDGSYKYVLISANPTWSGKYTGNGFNASVSPNGISGWTEFETFYGLDESGKKGENFVAPIVAMASLTQLKDSNGEFMDAWMGFFHDDNAYNYKSILTFDENGNMQWSIPEKYFANYRKIEKSAFMCEVEVIRSDGGKGNQLCLLGRSNGKGGNKQRNSLISFSNDEGKTWSEPKEVPSAYSGERHKAEWIKDETGQDRLFITFRSIDQSPEKLKTAKGKRGSGNSQWFSEGWVGWVGTYQDLIEGKEGQYRVKLAHTYLLGQTKVENSANADTGYCGNVVMKDGRVMTSSYGTFKSGEKQNNKFKDGTCIVSKVIDFALLDELIKTI